MRARVFGWFIALTAGAAVAVPLESHRNLQAVKEDGTFKSAEDLKKLYASAGVDGSKPIITYCRIGERSSHTWFVLTELLGYPNVRNYDGSWTEWGNAVGLPIEKTYAEA